ncbi:EscT/YscT/HrcT family type III secretion system export apparatus protein [Pandoraea pnomenusa]|uniref:type III secretion system export apparatus subunit SctT n=1 Tax=Pandoraea pnomenusa TaxID=93220 RepID=UPI00119840F9|nr:type III secretion system export apparatus subunit SctT [Pandoraea pnomenusa]QDX20570.1 EscT/YscT/HrcT family type III secretion system export apparatus protein [Pandoraea pnomenusa]
MPDITLPWLNDLDVKLFLVTWSLSIPRLLGMALLLPVLGSQNFPGLLRVGICGGFALLVIPATAPHIPAAGLSAAVMAGIALKESLLGLMLGFLLAVPFWSIESVGFIIDNQCGASISATLNPFDGHDTSPLGVLYSQAFAAFFIATGGLTLVLGLVYESYRLWPVMSAMPKLAIENAPAWLGVLNGMMAIALALAAPAMLLMYLAEISLALMSSFVPQLQVFFMAMPIKSALALFVLAAYGTTLFHYADRDITGLRDAIPHLARLMGAP